MKTFQANTERLTAWAFFAATGAFLGILLICCRPFLVELIDLIQFQLHELTRLAANPYNFV